MNIAPVAVEQVITPKTKAILPVYLFGQTAAMAQLLTLAERIQAGGYLRMPARQQGQAVCLQTGK